MTATSNVTVERLTLHAGAMSESEARRLAELVALALARLPKPPQSVDTANLRVDVPAQQGRDVAEIADAVAAAITAALTLDAVR
jgi:hypothetical protein